MSVLSWKETIPASWMRTPDDSEADCGTWDFNRVGRGGTKAWRLNGGMLFILSLGKEEARERDTAAKEWYHRGGTGAVLESYDARNTALGRELYAGKG